MIRAFLLTALVSLAPATTASAFDWLYSQDQAQPEQPQRQAAATRPTASSTDHGICIAAIRQAEIRHGIPENLLLAIGLQEAGLKRDGVLTIWPWTVNSHGSGYRFNSKPEVLSFVASEFAKGKNSVDVGCMQINMKWHGQHFANVREAMDPYANADYAARFLKGLYNESGHWMTAAGNYHSKTPDKHRKYLSGLERNLAVATKWADKFDALANVNPRVAVAMANAPIVQDKASAIKTPRKSAGRSATTTSLLRPSAYQRQMERRNKKQARIQPRQQRKKDIQNQNEASSRLTGLWWTAELSNRGSSLEKRTIYSGANIEPVIPDLIDMN